MGILAGHATTKGKTKQQCDTGHDHEFAEPKKV